jgi:tetratricopeptide (TPR) repeat protein
LAIDQFGGRYHRSELIPSAKESAEMAAEAYMHLAQYAADHDFADEEHRKQVSGYYARAGYYYRMIGKFDAAKSAYQNALNYGRLDTASQITALRGLRDVSTTKKDYVDYAL